MLIECLALADFRLKYSALTEQVLWLGSCGPWLASTPLHSLTACHADDDQTLFHPFSLVGCRRKTCSERPSVLSTPPVGRVTWLTNNTRCKLLARQHKSWAAAVAWQTEKFLHEFAHQMVDRLQVWRWLLMPRHLKAGPYQLSAHPQTLDSVPFAHGRNHGKGSMKY